MIINCILSIFGILASLPLAASDYVSDITSLGVRGNVGIFYWALWAILLGFY